MNICTPIKGEAPSDSILIDGVQSFKSFLENEEEILTVTAYINCHHLEFLFVFLGYFIGLLLVLLGH